jgi:transcriptional regulator with PAS, ATPase and Fis domain
MRGKTEYTPTNLFGKVREFERGLIASALAANAGLVSLAAEQLGISHQSLTYIINSRHRELLAERSPVIKRRRGF